MRGDDDDVVVGAVAGGGGAGEEWDEEGDVCKLFHDVLIRSCVFFSCLFAHCPYLWCVCAYPCASPGGCVVHPMTIGTITHSHVYSSR